MPLGSTQQHRGFGRVGRRAAVLVVFALVSAANAAERLTIRLVEASNTSAGVSAELRDVEPLLRRNLPFQRFELLETRSVRLPASDTIPFAAGLTVRCDGDARRLSVQVSAGGRLLLQTQLTLTDRAPVILGGFSTPGGRQLLVLTTP